MKKYIFLLLPAVFISGLLSAQVTAENRVMVTGSQPALVVKLKGADPKFAEAEWKDYTKSYGKVIKVKGSKESVIEGIHVKDIGQGTLLNVYSLATPSVDGSDMIVWFNRGGSYLESSDKEYATAEEFLKTFAIKVNVDMIALDLEEQQKKQSKLENDLTRLQKVNENLHKDITNAKAKIDQAEIDIPLNVKAQETAQADIANQKGVVESVKENPEEYKIQQKLLAKLESNYTKLQKENESLHKTVTDSNAKIKQAELDIETNLEEQKAANQAIADQKIVVDLVQKKLDEARSQKPK
ncbi:MAG: hypothetical protein KA166_02815 [Saprospiraceae bacterium]|nr:hypothetical protein [Candidatus Opimibacter skivensis]MBP6680094.1 hypothetical protein [Saprospiraceae bacterium]